MLQHQCQVDGCENEPIECVLRGVERFDFAPDGLCENCRDQFREDDLREEYEDEIFAIETEEPYDC